MILRTPAELLELAQQARAKGLVPEDMKINERKLGQLYGFLVDGVITEYDFKDRLAGMKRKDRCIWEDEL